MISTREQILSQRQTKQQQMECYETNETDVPATTTNVIHEKQMKTRTNEDVLTAELQPALAFEKFAGKIYQDNEAVARHRLVTLTSQRGTYESTPTTSSSLSRYQHFESPLDRYARLKNEINEFHQDLKLLTNTKIDPVMADTATTISNNLESLSKELLSLLQDNRYQSILQSNNNASAIPTTHTDLVQNLVTQLEAFTTETKEAAKPTTTTASPAPVTYELYYQPEKDTVAHHQQLNLVSLDRRLAAAEKWVGVNDGVTPLYPDLQSGVNHLSTKLELLDQHKLEAVYRKVKGLMSELELLEQAKQQVQPNKQQIQEEKVNELYELMQRWDIAAQQLPIIVSRLQAVRDLHQESSTVIVRLQALEQQQSAITSLLQSDRDALQAVSTSLATNVKTMANNVATLEQRFKALEQRLNGGKK